MMIAILAAGTLHLAVPRPPAHGITGFGIYGGISCANAWKPAFLAGTRAYVAGLWSGMNEARQATVGHSVSEEGGLERVRARCAAQPTQLLGNVASRTYHAMDRHGE